MGARPFKRDYGRTGLTASVTSRTGETVNVQNPLVVRTKNREPRVQILAEDLVLSRRVGLNRPEGIARYGHAIH
jgi:hypothetical protein